MRIALGMLGSQVKAAGAKTKDTALLDGISAYSKALRSAVTDIRPGNTEREKVVQILEAEQIIKAEEAVIALCR